MKTAALLLITAVLTFTGTALATTGTVNLAVAADAAPPDASWLDLVRPVFDAIVGGQPLLAAALGLVLAVALARKYLTGRFPVLGTDAGGTALTFAGALGTAFAAAFAAGTAPSLALAKTALLFAATTSGGYTALKRLVVPALRWLESKAPAWLKPFLAPVLKVLLWAFENRTVAKAEAAGDAAVKANPGAGAGGVVKVDRTFP